MLYLLAAPTPAGLYFKLGNTTYFPGQSVVISDIGKQPSDPDDAGLTLVCVTTNINTNCCRPADSGNEYSIGDWYYPTGEAVLRPFSLDTSMNTLAEVAHSQQVRLSAIGKPTGPLGKYTCKVPAGDTLEMISASINIIAPKTCE